MGKREAPRLPRSLKVLRRKCTDLFDHDRVVIACETPILIKNNGDVHAGAANMFLLPFDLQLAHPFHFLWGELRLIELGIKAGGYTRKEVEALEGYMDVFADSLGNLPRALDWESYTIVRDLNLLN